MRLLHVTVGVLVAGASLGTACVSPQRDVAAVLTDAGSSGFGNADAGPDASVDPANSASETLYCPTSECPAGFTTCEDSRFPCDADLLTDERNCGACGHACPERRAAGASWECIGGECVMRCSTGLDCDGIVDNGCETNPTYNNDHCGACNVKCDWSNDPTQICVLGQCGCPVGLLFCDSGDPLIPGYCVDPNSDDNCGACGNECDRTGGHPGPLPANGYYGCKEKECGKLKCDEHYADCDDDETNGCETPTFSDDNCGGCGIKCEGGTHCFQNAHNEQMQCMCPPGTSWCLIGRDRLDFDIGQCVDFSSDDENCGGCNVECIVGVGLNPPFPNARETCVNGSCELYCLEGSADCNGNRSDGCETNISSDPRNCGGCGIQCDLAAGQACAAGRCMAAPCAPDEETTQ